MDAIEVREFHSTNNTSFGYLNSGGKVVLHREDGPALISKSGKTSRRWSRLNFKKLGTLV
jgi:hypothetical protein